MQHEMCHQGLTRQSVQKHGVWSQGNTSDTMQKNLKLNLFQELGKASYIAKVIPTHHLRSQPESFRKIPSNVRQLTISGAFLSLITRTRSKFDTSMEESWKKMHMKQMKTNLNEYVCLLKLNENVCATKKKKNEENNRTEWFSFFYKMNATTNFKKWWQKWENWRNEIK